MFLTPWSFIRGVSPLVAVARCSDARDRGLPALHEPTTTVVSPVTFYATLEKTRWMVGALASLLANVSADITVTCLLRFMQKFLRGESDQVSVASKLPRQMRRVNASHFYRSRAAHIYGCWNTDNINSSRHQSILWTSVSSQLRSFQQFFGSFVLLGLPWYPGPWSSFFDGRGRLLIWNKIASNGSMANRERGSS